MGAVPRVWRERKADPDAWNALLRYYESVGLPWLHATDLEDLVPVGSSHSSGSDVTGWDRCPPGLNR